VHASDVLQQFSYEEARHEAGWIRADLRVDRGRREGGMFASAARIRGDALRPGTAANHHFWNRSGAMDSFEGSILDIFSQETWLFDGRAEYAQRAFGGWVETPVAGWNCRFGLAYQFLELRARGHLTQRTTTLLIAYDETDHFPDFPGMRARIMTPETRISRNFGRAFVAITAAQAIPLSAETKRKENGDDPRSPVTGSSWTGGTEAKLEVGWGVF
jgi:hypothetical protein